MDILLMAKNDFHVPEVIKGYDIYELWFIMLPKKEIRYGPENGTSSWSRDGTIASSLFT